MSTSTPADTAPDAAHRPDGLLRFAPLLALPVPLAWFGYVLSNNPTDRIPDPTGPCTWHALFGIDGPYCGITRMTWYLLHGDLVGAARMHLAAVLLIPLGAYAWIAWTANWILGTRLPMPRFTRGWAIGYVAFFLLYSTVLRNLPWAPFTWFYAPDLT